MEPNSKILSRALGFPQNKFRSIHVAGTNGKGSVSFKLAKALSLSGYRVGLFSSPHLFDYRERIQINGSVISQEEVNEGMSTLLSLASQLQIRPTFFELTTLLGFLYFARHQVDVAIIEVGIGGRLDATNIIIPILSIITTIDRDHSAILGETLDDIAREKAGIIKHNVPLVLGERAQRKPILVRATALNASVTFAAGDPDPEQENRLIARTAARVLQQELTFSEEGFSESPRCRYERKGNIIFDVAHNGAAFQKLFERVKRDFPERKIHLLFGVSYDKDLDDLLPVILPQVDHIHLIKCTHPRLMPVKQIIAALKARNYQSYSEGFVEDNQAILVVAGSFYIIDSARHQTSCESLLQGDKTLFSEQFHLPFQ